jgi:hypothetical protein
MRSKSTKADVVKSQAWQLALIALVCTIAANAIAPTIAHIVVRLSKESRR